jgi:DNA polymerase III subunit delta
VSSSLYLVVGEPFLADEALQRIRSEAGTDFLSEVSLDAGSTAQEILEALETPSLLSDKRLVVVDGAESLKKDHVEALTRYMEAPAPSSVLVLISSSGRTKLTDLAKRLGVVVSLDPPRGRRLLSWVRQRAEAHGLKLDDKGAWALLDAVGTELRDLDGALSQLATRLGPPARVGAAEVRAAFPRLADQRVYAFTDAVGDRRLDEAMGTLRRLLDQGEPPLVLFGALSAHVRRLLLAHRVESSRAAGSLLGLPDWRAERLLKQARSYKEEDLIEAMSVLAEADVEMKAGDAPLQETPLEQAVVRIVSGTQGARPRP